MTEYCVTPRICPACMGESEMHIKLYDIELNTVFKCRKCLNEFAIKTRDKPIDRTIKYVDKYEVARQEKKNQAPYSLPVRATKKKQYFSKYKINTYWTKEVPCCIECKTTVIQRHVPQDVCSGCYK